MQYSRNVRIGVLGALVWLVPHLTLAQDARDAAFFGDAEDETPAENIGTSTISSVDDPTDAVVTSQTFADEEPTIGGQLYLQSDVTASDGQRAANASSGQRALLFLYLDQRPSSATRVFVKGSLLHPMGPTDQFTDRTVAFDRPNARIEELWLKLDVDQNLFITVGTQPIRWGVNRVWNPTDFLNQQQRDPLAIFDARPGVSCLKVHIPFENSGSNLYFLVRPGEESRIGDLRYSLRFEQVMGTAEWSISTDTGYQRPLKVGSDLSLAIGPLDLKGEIATQSTAPNTRYGGSLDLEAGILPTAQDKDEWAIQWSTGLEWGIAYDDDRSLYLTVEYFQNPLGYHDGANLYPWLFAQGTYQPLYLGQTYLGANVAMPLLGKRKNQTIVVSSIANLSDQTYLLRFDYQISVLTRLRLSGFVTTYHGNQGEFRYAFEIPAGLVGPDAISIPAPKATVGLWAAIGF